MRESLAGARTTALHMVATMLIFTLSDRHDRKPPRACQSLEFSDADRENAPCLSLLHGNGASLADQHAVRSKQLGQNTQASLPDSGRCIQTALSRIGEQGFNASRFVSAGKQSSSQLSAHDSLGRPAGEMQPPVRLQSPASPCLPARHHDRCPLQCHRRAPASLATGKPAGVQLLRRDRTIAIVEKVAVVGVSTSPLYHEDKEC